MTNETLKNNKLTIEQGGHSETRELTEGASKELGTVRLPNDEEVEAAKVISQNITDRQTEINSQLEGLDEDQQTLVLGEMLSDYGVSVDDMKQAVDTLADNPMLPPSSIFSNLGWLPISEMLQRISLSFEFGDLFPHKMIRNGLHRIFYRDFWKADALSAYKQEDYKFDTIHNPKGGIVTEEIWSVNTNLHMGFTMWDASLNQNTRDIALFIAMFNEFEWNVMKPIQVEFYRVHLRMLAVGIDYNSNPLSSGVDWSKLPVDVTISGKDEYEALTNLFNWLDGINQPSRKNLPERYNPKGMAQNLMTSFRAEDYMLVGPNDFMNTLNVQIKSGRFHDHYLNPKVAFKGIDFDKAFGEFNSDTGYKTTFKECDLRLVPKATANKGAWVITQYEGVRSQPNLNLTSVTHFWTLYGVAFHRETPIFNIKFKIGETPSK